MILITRMNTALGKGLSVPVFVDQASDLIFSDRRSC
jgi:hypothetical protein